MDNKDRFLTVSPEDDEVSFVIQRKEVIEVKLKYPAGFIYLRGHNLENIYHGLLKDQNEDTFKIVDKFNEMPIVLIPKDVIEIFTSIKKRA